jgi:hypothetical protein
MQHLVHVTRNYILRAILLCEPMHRKVPIRKHRVHQPGRPVRDNEFYRLCHMRLQIPLEESQLAWRKLVRATVIIGRAET